jgi:DNA-binding NarL/FixJ family response regulator
MIPDSNEIIVPTPRERELMMLIARGMQNKNIAYTLHISENTVRAHIGNIMRKYHLQNRTQIAIIFTLDSQPVSALATTPAFPYNTQVSTTTK